MIIGIDNEATAAACDVHPQLLNQNPTPQPEQYQPDADELTQMSPKSSEKGSIKSHKFKKDGSNSKGSNHNTAQTLDQFADLRKSMQRIERVIESGGVSQKNRQT